MPYCLADLSAYVRLRHSDGATSVLVPGDLVGRLSSAALHLHDARISEAHALLSLRGQELKLLGLRGRFAVGGRVVDEVVLWVGQTIEFAPGLSVEVIDAEVPDEVLALQGEGLARQILSGVCSLELNPRPRLVARYVGDAAAHLWTIGGAWAVRVGDGSARPLGPGDTFEAGGETFTAVSVSLAEAGEIGRAHV